MGSISDPSKLKPNPRLSLFSTLPPIPADEPFSVNGAYLSDTHPQKVNLGIGVYRTSTGNPWPLNVVEEAESRIYDARNKDRHEYLSIQGDREFLNLASDLVFGFDSTTSPQIRDRVTSVQTVSGTGANRLGAELLSRHIRPKTVWIPNPTWANHHTIWDLAGVPEKSYPYYDAQKKKFNYIGTMESLSKAQKNDVVILHACAHNPTGADPTPTQWESIARLCAERGLIPFFDLAYQGFASGDAAQDAWAIRHFFGLELEFCVAQSFSKNFGLYGQRVGALHVVSFPSLDKNTAAGGVGGDILANLCHLVRGEYSMAPRGGAEIVRTVLGDAELRGRWYEDLGVMSTRIQDMRRALYGELVRLGTPGSWEHVLDQVCSALILRDIVS
ncbi:pyridoxal phosphate-dependent transferase [Penicillium argentinense]|uniref:Aspartate aminotransferase n=1 Tax=Penicillium argentinense TaxID=1131581 RepID=A0A9W9F7H4_9EURO|nr:pyridoxal phosphate-dependent transferase [Penicillium argentinense]KAJ5095043.1 pyridoxal phosphate-dependent transferase [Penicillium argentinense]